MGKIIKYLVVIIVSIALVLTAAVVIAYNFYANQIIWHTINQLNKKLIVKVDVQQVSFDIYKNFPHAAIAFNNATISTTSPCKDTLLICETMYVQFNWLKIIKKEYTIEGIGISNAKLHLALDSTGKFMHHILAKNMDNVSGANVFAIRRIWMKNTSVRLTVEQKEKISTQIIQLRFNGEIKPELLSGQLALHCENLKIATKRKQNLIHDLKISTDCYRDSKITRCSGKVRLNHENFIGTFISNEYYQSIDIKGNSIRGKNLSPILPPAVFKQLPHPKFDLHAQIKMQKSARKQIYIKAHCKLRDNDLILSQNLSGRVSGNLRYEGRLPENIHRIDVNGGNFYTQHSHINFSGLISGKQNQWNTEASGSGSLDLKEMHKFFDSLSLKLSEGTVLFTFTAKKQAVPFDKLFSEKDWEYSIEAKTENATGSLYQTRLDSLTAICLVQPQYIEIRSLKSLWENSSVYFSGNIETKHPTQIEGELKFNNINIDKILKTINQSNSSNSDMTVRLQFHAEAGTFKNHPFKALRTKILMSDSITRIYNLSVNFLNGNIADLNYENKGTTTSLEGRINSIDIRQLIQLSENFGFSPLKKENVSGKLSVSGQIQWSKLNNKIEYNKMLGKFDVTINQGRLIQYAPLKEIMKYINIREPEDVRLSPLQIQLNIKDNSLWIQQLRVQSSAIDFTVWGNHTFDNHYEYHFKFYLADIMKKQNHEKKQNIPVTEVEDSTKMPVVFLVLKGKETNYSVSYDTKSSLANFRERWKGEQKALRSILKEELSPRENPAQSEKIEVHNKQRRPTVIIEEFETEQHKTPSKPTQKKRPVIEWKDDDN